MVRGEGFEPPTPAVWRLRQLAILLFKINKLARHFGAKVV